MRMRKRIKRSMKGESCIYVCTKGAMTFCGKFTFGSYCYGSDYFLG